MNDATIQYMLTNFASVEIIQIVSNSSKPLFPNLIFQTDSNNLNYTVKGLRPGHLYQFEVCAINKEGISLPCKTRDPIRAENPYSKLERSLT